MCRNPGLGVVSREAEIRHQRRLGRAQNLLALLTREKAFKTHDDRVAFNMHWTHVIMGGNLESFEDEADWDFDDDGLATYVLEQLRG